MTLLAEEVKSFYEVRTDIDDGYDMANKMEDQICRQRPTENAQMDAEKTQNGVAIGAKNKRRKSVKLSSQEQRLYKSEACANTVLAWQ